MRFIGILIFAKDMREMTAFYRDGLGLVPVAKQPFAEHRLFQFEGGVALHSAGTPTGSKNKLQFEVDSLRAARERLVRFGKRVRKIEPFEGRSCFDIRDPEGNRIQIHGDW